MIEDLTDPVVVVALLLGALAAVIGMVFTFRAVNRCLRDRHFNRTRVDACARLDSLAAAISYTDLLIGKPEFNKTNYRADLYEIRENFATLVEKRDLYMLPETAVQLQQWEAVRDVAESRIDELRRLVEGGRYYLLRVEEARNAIRAAEAVVNAYADTVEPRGSVDFGPAREQIERAQRLFDQLRFEDCRKVCAAMEVMVQVCEEASLLKSTLDDLSAKAVEGTWLHAAVEAAVTARQNAVRYLHHEGADKSRDLLKATRLKLLSAVDDPEGSDLLNDEDNGS